MSENSEGISISNHIADLMIGDDQWSIERFRTYYESATLLSALFIVTTLILVITYYVKNKLRE
ncbi:hypothetical protein [Paenibacillus lemnae]|uniref:Uncharacterized protein n=1 Tax=Paenibacillus lemnae TaxID=1330551 RepID=A0A848M6B3_PAELE|nr:hypothetical protein [Paenibacillus lemnae]NMO95751.1 hypothetical protein [Paenibacillus lemnae]